MNIETFKITTGMGKIGKNDLPFLTEKERGEFNVIGHSGKLNGVPMGREGYLNTLDKGKFKVTKTKSDNGDFCEEFEIIRVTEANINDVKNNSLTSLLSGKIIESVSMVKGNLSIKTKDGFTLDASGGSVDTTHSTLRYDGKIVIDLTESF